MDHQQKRKARRKVSLEALLLLTVAYTCDSAFSTAFSSKHIGCRGSFPKAVATALPIGGETQDGTLVELITPNNQHITLIGTAHMSKASQDQVEAVIQRVQPNVVLVELDPSRLPRIGIDGVKDIQVSRVVTAAEDVLVDDNSNGGGGLNLVQWWQRTFLDVFSRVARVWLTSMYDGMRDRHKLVRDNPTNGEVIPGGEFLVAIRVAEQCKACDTIVLGDRSSVFTIQRAAQLAWKSGDALGVFERLKFENDKAMGELRAAEVGLDCMINPSKEDEARLEMAVMEALKNDPMIRESLFRRLEENVPQFTQAFLKERDLIMAESIRRELVRPEVGKVVAVVGLAHVPGIRDNLQASFVTLSATTSLSLL
jgi:hypothetical protein